MAYCTLLLASKTKQCHDLPMQRVLEIVVRGYAILAILSEDGFDAMSVTDECMVLNVS